MKNQFKKAFPYVMFLTAWAVIFAAVLLGERIPEPLSLALFTVGGVLLGFGAVGIALSLIHLSPERQKEYERSETDELVTTSATLPSGKKRRCPPGTGLCICCGRRFS